MTNRSAVSLACLSLHVVRRARPALLALSLAVPMAASATDLKDIYTLAKEYDPTLQAAVATHQAARQQLPLARSAFLPQVNLGFDAGIGETNDDRGGVA